MSVDRIRILRGPYNSYKEQLKGEAIAKIEELYQEFTSTEKELREELSKYSSGEKEKEFETMVKDIRKRSLVTLSPKEYEANESFREKHREKCKNITHFIYDLQGCMFGVGIIVKCPVCGEKEDITDMDCW